MSCREVAQRLCEDTARTPTAIFFAEWRGPVHTEAHPNPLR